MGGFALAQDGFTQLVEVEPGAGPVALVQIGPQLLFLGRKNHTVCFSTQPGHD